MVWARSAKIGPKLRDVATGTPFTNFTVLLATVEPSGKFAMFDAIVFVKNCSTALFASEEAGMKCSPWTAVAGCPAVPTRKSGSSPPPKKNSSFNTSRIVCWL